jgi:hypothetical protein
MRFAFVVPLLLLTIGSVCHGQPPAAQPNFSGIWKLDPEKSDFAAQVPPKEAEYIIRHVGSKLSFNYIQDGNISRVDITPDNEERITNTTEENAIWTRAYWSGNVLVLEAREKKRYGSGGATGANWTSRWSLSPDRNTFIIERTIRNAGVEVTQRIFFDKQPLNNAPRG